MILKKIFQYFPALSTSQKDKIQELGHLYGDWNDKINLISRKDMNFFYERHVLHSLAIAAIMKFRSGTRVMDAGTGGGFPGIPLAILFPEVSFHLVDSIGKKIKVVKKISSSLKLENVTAAQARVETLSGPFNNIVSRAVTSMSTFYSWVHKIVDKTSSDEPENGILFLKGGDLVEEITKLGKPHKIYALSDYFSETFFETKKLIYVPVIK